MWRFVIIVITSFYFNNVLCRPSDEPTKFVLNPSNATSEEPGFVLSTLQQSENFLERITNSIRIGTGRLVNSAVLARNIIARKAEDVVSDGRNSVAAIFLARRNVPTKKPRSATFISSDEVPEEKLATSSSNQKEISRLENEKEQAFFEVRREGPVSSVLENFLKPTPLIDNIQEHEKYGNDGDKFMRIGKALVNGFEGFSNFLNSILDFPVNAAKKSSRGLTEALNKVGARIIGLE